MNTHLVERMEISMGTRRLFATIATALGLLGCAEVPDAPSPEAPVELAAEEARAATPMMNREAVRRWSLHLRANWDDVQPNCRPTRISPRAGVQQRGVVMMFHGYTACPQQFFEWGRILAAQGYEVLLPLSPGHGRTQVSMRDNTRALPALSTTPYESFVTDMNAIMAEVQTPVGTSRVIGGLSLGGALATLAVQQQPSLYDRAFIASPFFESGNFWVTALARASEQLRRTQLRAVTEAAWQRAGEIDLGWGEGCEVERRGGRAGICQFQVKHFASIVRLGARTVDAVRPGRTQIQFIGVEDDQAASNSAIRRAAGSYGAASSLCFYRHPASHSLFSRYDNPTEDKFWLPSLFVSATAFVTRGERFATDGASAEPGAQQCRLTAR